MLKHPASTIGAALAALAAVVAGLFISGAFVVSSAGTTVSIGSGSGDVSQDVAVALEATGVPEPGAGAITVAVNYNPLVIQPTAQDADPNGAFNLALCNDLDSGTVSCTYVVAAGVTGDLLLANLTFHCEAGGVSPLDVVVQTFADAAGAPIPVVDQDGSIQCILHNEIPVCQDVNLETDEDAQGSTEPGCSDPDVDQPTNGTANVGSSLLSNTPTPTPGSGAVTTPVAHSDTVVNPIRAVSSPEANVAQSQASEISAGSGNSPPTAVVGIGAGAGAAGIVLLIGIIWSVRRRPHPEKENPRR